jgi:hypothetical protein
MRHFARFLTLLLVPLVVWLLYPYANPFADYIRAVPTHPLRLTWFSQIAESASSPAQPTIPTVRLAEYGYAPVSLLDHTRSSDPANPFATIRKTGAAFQAPDKPLRFEITAHNYESITRSFTIHEQLPATLAYVAGSAVAGLSYDSASRSLFWQGDIPPAHLDYLFSPSPNPLPYIDLADFGIPNLCDTFLVADTSTCADEAVTFNLGINNQAVTLYGLPYHQLTVTTAGTLLFGDAPVVPNGRNQRLPAADQSNAIIAGLWRAVDMTVSGRWHVAILDGLIADHAVFYAQWHDTPSAADPNLTARHAIALVLDGAGQSGGHIFYLYDNISDPEAFIAHGYTIGIQDTHGSRGSSFAYAPCCDGTEPAQGYPPAAGTTLHLRPALLNADADYTRTFSYTAIVRAPVPSNIMTTVYADNDSPNPHLAHSWSTHYLHVREQAYLPIVRRESGSR